MRKLDLTGQRFGRLQAVKQTVKTGRIKWDCKCDCGGECAVAVDKLRSGHTLSCGCYKFERISQAKTTHGMRHCVEYRLWADMKTRCTNPAYYQFGRYGGRGIKVADEWLNDFGAFYAHIGPRTDPTLTLDRINNDGNYEPGNVRWATRKVQANNRSTSKLRA